MPYSNYYEETLARSDGDGLALLWGGTVNGSLAEGDVLSAPYDFDYTYTHTPAGEYDSPSASWKLTLGLISNPSMNWADGVSSGSGYNSYTSGYTTDVGSFNETGTIDLTIQSWMLDEYNLPTHWFVILEVLTPHENASNDYEAPYPKWNGDILTVSVPQNSIDLAYSPIPEPSSLLLSAAGGLMLIHRRRKS